MQGDRGLNCQQAELDRGQALGWWLRWAVSTMFLRTGPSADRYWKLPGCQGRGVFPGPSVLAVRCFFAEDPDGKEAVPERHWARRSGLLLSTPPPPPESPPNPQRQGAPS